MSIAGRKKSTLTLGQDGKHPRKFFAAKGEVGLVPDHGPSATTNANYAAPHTGKRKSHLSVSVHNGFQPTPPGGRGHPQGEAPVIDGGSVPTGRVHPFAKAPSPQLAHGKCAPVAWSNGGASMRNRNNDHPHGGASSASGCESGDPVRELSFADPTHPGFRGKKL